MKKDDVDKTTEGKHLKGSRDMIRLVLRQLRDEGAIKKVGKGRGAKWKTQN